MSEIFISISRGLRAVIDDADFPLVQGELWHAVPRDASTGGYYARSKLGYMHRIILNAPSDMQVDHIDGDGLNNRRSNLRLATQRLNCVNRRAGFSPVSGYRGVYRSGRDNAPWQVELTSYGKRRRLGRYTDKAEAARAYDRAAIECFGEFAVLNFPEGQP